MNAPTAPIRRLTVGAGSPALCRNHAANNQARRPRRQSGFSLVELMIAMTIGLFLIATLGYIMLGAKASFNTIDALSRMQENARFAFETMAKDIRMAGFTGGPPASAATQNIVNAPLANTWDPNLINLYSEDARGDGPLAGYDDDGGDTFPLGVAGQTGLTGDALTIVRADTDNEYALTNTSPLTLSTWPAIGAPAAGEIFVAADYSHSVVFQSSSVSSGPRTVSHALGPPPTPGNTVTALGAFTGDIGAAKLYRLSGVTYHVKTNPGGEPALYRLTLGRTDAGDANHPGAKAEAVEVVEGVADMQIEYGEDTANDGQVDFYRRAHQVVDWDRVLSVRITLSLVSQQDGLLGKTITNTIAVRNRLP